MINFDELLADIGEFGAYQKWMAVLCCIPGIVAAFVFVGFVFIGERPPFWCRGPGVETFVEKCGWTLEEEKKYTVPTGSNAACFRYDVEWNQTDLECAAWESRVANVSAIDLVPVAPCGGEWVYDWNRTSLATEFNLVCTDSWKLEWTQSSLSVGYLIGAVLTGYVADRYGRKFCFLISTFGLAVSSVIVSFLPNYILLQFFRILQGFFAKGVWMASNVLVAEIVGANYRRIVGIMAQILFTVGIIILPGIAYIIPSWKMLNLAISLPTFILLLYYWFLPESPRWLLMCKKNKEAIRIAKIIAKHNGRPFPTTCEEVDTDESDPENRHTPSVLDVFKTAQLKKYSLILMYSWFSCVVVYQGLVMRLGIIGRNLYFDFFLSGLMELPSAFIILVTVDRVGRRPPFAFFSVLAGLACLITAFIPESLSWLKTSISIIGRLAITTVFEILYLINTEIFPTPLRNLGISICSSLCDIGGIVAPLLLYRLAAIWVELPLILYAVFALLNGGLILLLPETRGIDLPETLEDLEALERKQHTKTEKGNSKSCSSYM
ncbi:solute carrier family 22 member 2 [Erpetoichthys calabaricus]|uniref:solute carrier family 22 member 2 n=1 Tax=Erpetoichthys calabaricus TaxID=27687 RepID=UPI0022340013|nr:solute carrier family 22 member 2 [Erpetoichthys calabaricus]